jgi:hypothetical protein
LAAEKEKRRITMKNTIIFLFTVFAQMYFANAGNINVVNLTQETPLKILLTNESSEHTLSVESRSSSRPFKLKDAPASLAPTAKGLPNLEIPHSETHRIAVLFPTTDSAEWKLIPSEASDEAWSFRIINLTGEEVKYTHHGKPLEIGKDEETKIEVGKQKDIALTPSGGELTGYRFNEPCSVIAFLTKSQDKIIVTFISDL